jgi:energy-coupling factor transporter transmembrane protein EcfT
MERARRARTFGAVSWVSGWSAAGRRLGLLVIRALNRAERIHGAMCARGWTGAARRIDFPPQTS